MVVASHFGYLLSRVVCFTAFSMVCASFALYLANSLFFGFVAIPFESHKLFVYRAELCIGRTTTIRL